MSERVLSILNLYKRYAKGQSYAVDNVCMDVHEGEIVALVGKSGSGKTTLLRMIAGLEMPSGGQIAINEALVYGEGTYVPPEKRGVGMVFQEYALFPHLTVEKNVAFGLQELSNGEKQQRIDDTLKLVGLEGLHQRYPHELSGGQQQRVALARALAPRPALLLLDEPFSNLDQELCFRLREDVTRILKELNTTCLVVTHNIDDAFAIADQVAMLKQGMLIQKASPEIIYSYPKTIDIANFFGKANIMEGKLVEEGIETSAGLIKMYIQPYFSLGKSVRFCVRPEHIRLSKEAKEEGLKGVVMKVTFAGKYKVVKVLERSTGQELTIHLSTDDRYDIGESVTMIPDPYRIVFFNVNEL